MEVMNGVMGRGHGGGEHGWGAIVYILKGSRRDA